MTTSVLDSRSSILHPRLLWPSLRPGTRASSCLLLQVFVVIVLFFNSWLLYPRRQHCSVRSSSSVVWLCPRSSHCLPTLRQLHNAPRRLSFAVPSVCLLERSCIDLTVTGSHTEHFRISSVTKMSSSPSAMDLLTVAHLPLHSPQAEGKSEPFYPGLAWYKPWTFGTQGMATAA